MDLPWVILVRLEVVGLLESLMEFGLEGMLELLGLPHGVASKLWALRDGINLSFPKSPNYWSLVRCQAGSKANEPSKANDTILADFKEGMKRIPLIKIQHHYRKANKCADAPAQRGVNLTQEFVIFVEPPADVKFLLNLDITRVMVNHSVPSVSVAR